MKLKGIDVSKWQGIINWEKVKPNIDFCFIRGGFGTLTDPQFHRNASECSRLKIPFGIYWFSYALDKEMAKIEADTVCELAKGYNVTLPIVFDFEDDSENFAIKNGKNLENSDRIAIARAFLARVNTYGYTPCLYVNKSQYETYGKNVGFAEFGAVLWLAQWYVDEPDYSCQFWQYSDRGTINGISGAVDLNYWFRNDINDSENQGNSELSKIKDELWNNYLETAKKVMQGKYSNGYYRFLELSSEGYDPNIVQKIVNVLWHK